MKIYKLSAILFVFLAGCAPEIAEWTPAESPKENKVDRAVFTYTIHYPAHASTMGENEKKNFYRFLKKNILSPSAVTIILEEFGGRSEKRIKDVERELLRYGVPYELITVDDDPGENHCKHGSHKHQGKGGGSGVEVIVEQYIVIPPSCGDFSQQIGNARQERAPSNFGCSNKANFGMMVANPRDLLRGGPMGGSDGPVIAAGVNRYRHDKVKALMETSTNVAPGSTSQSSAGQTGGLSGGVGGATSSGGAP